MRKLLLPFVLCSVAAAQEAPATPPAAKPKTPPDKVVARIDGKDYTAGEIDKIVAAFPSPVRGAFQTKPADTLTWILIRQHLAAEAEAHQLDAKPEFKQAADWARLQALSNDELSYAHNAYRPSQQDERSYYEKNSEEWEQAKFQEIVISFAQGPGQTQKRKEEEAKALMDEIQKKLESGADFGALAKEYSEDKTSAAKNGENGPIGRASAYPEPLKKLLFNMKPGEVSKPTKWGSSYYLVRLQDITKQSYNDVETQIFRKLQQQHFNSYMEDINKANKVQILNSKFFSNGAK